MSDNVIKLVPDQVGEDYRFKADDILEAAKGKGLSNVVVMGELENGDIWVSSAANAGEALILTERAKHFIAFGGDDD